MSDDNLLLQENWYPNAPDIKARLREHDSSRSSCLDSDMLCNEAADYIEQLERELAAKDQRIVELSEELDAERVRLAACGVAAMANTRQSMAERITKDNPYWSASYGDVCKAVDREVAYREQIESQPSAEALVQAALEAAAKACETAEVPIGLNAWLGTKKELSSATAIGLSEVIRALSAQQIIEEASK